MFGLSWIEIFIILVVALLVIGPDKLPEVARGTARVIRQFQRIISEMRESINMEEFEAKVRESSHYTPPNPVPPPPRITHEEELAQPNDGIQSKPLESVNPPSPHPAAAPVVVNLNKDDSARS